MHHTALSTSLVIHLIVKCFCTVFKDLEALTESSCFFGSFGVGEQLFFNLRLRIDLMFSINILKWTPVQLELNATGLASFIARQLAMPRVTFAWLTPLEITLSTPTKILAMRCCLFCQLMPEQTCQTFTASRWFFSWNYESTYRAESPSSIEICCLFPTKNISKM